MKFQVGDKVLVLHSNEEGEVVDIINPKMVMIDVRGVKFPAYTDQLDFPYFKRFSEKKLFPPESKQKKYIDQVPMEKKGKESDHKRSEQGEPGIWIAFIPVISADEFGDEIVDDLKIHLVNRTAKGYTFDYALAYLGTDNFTLTNQVHAFQDFYIHDMPFENMNDSPAFNFVFSLLIPDKKKAKSFEVSLKLKPKQVFTRIQEIRKKGEAVFSYKLLEEYPDRPLEDLLEMNPLLKAGYKVYSAASARQHLEPSKYEVDLHLEKLTDNENALNNFEKLTLQLQTLEKYLDLAVAHRQPSMIAIHGLGTGKLRDEIHEILRLRRDVKSFINRYHPAYGYGATEIFFQY
ncbi:MAG: Smr/MutS family protein [Flavitalea sp.]